MTWAFPKPVKSPVQNRCVPSSRANQPGQLTSAQLIWSSRKVPSHQKASSLVQSRISVFDAAKLSVHDKCPLLNSGTLVSSKFDSTIRWITDSGRLCFATAGGG